MWHYLYLLCLLLTLASCILSKDSSVVPCCPLPADPSAAILPSPAHGVEATWVLGKHLGLQLPGVQVPSWSNHLPVEALGHTSACAMPGATTWEWVVTLRLRLHCVGGYSLPSCRWPREYNSHLFLGGVEELYLHYLYTDGWCQCFCRRCALYYWSMAGWALLLSDPIYFSVSADACAVRVFPFRLDFLLYAFLLPMVPSSAWLNSAGVARWFFYFNIL
jgi:hypothetical protein